MPSTRRTSILNLRPRFPQTRTLTDQRCLRLCSSSLPDGPTTDLSLGWGMRVAASRTHRLLAACKTDDIYTTAVAMMRTFGRCYRGSSIRHGIHTDETSRFLHQKGFTNCGSSSRGVTGTDGFVTLRGVGCYPWPQRKLHRDKTASRGPILEAVVRDEANAILE
jgi:hypothetical protein